MKKLGKLINNISDKTSKLNKIDFIIMGIMVFLYGIISFYNLGDFIVPNTYYNFKDINDSVEIELKEESSVSKIRLYTGNNIGDFTIQVSNDKEEYHDVMNFNTNSVFSWQDVLLNYDSNFKYIKFVSKSVNNTLGDICLYDNDNNKISVVDKNNPLVDEFDLVPNDINYMNSMYFDEVYFARSAYEYVHGIDVFEWTHPPLGKLLMAIPILIFGFSPFTFRLMGNIAGILLIPAMYILTKKIFKNRKYAILGGLIMMFDNFHFADTRIALVDSFQILFILLSVIFMINYLELTKKDSFKKKSINLILSGFFIGCSISVKWNAMYVGIGLAIIFFRKLFKDYNVNIISLCKEKLSFNIILEYIIALFFIPFSLYYLLFLIINKKVATYIIIAHIITILIIILVKFIKFLKKDKYLIKLFIVCVISFIVIPIIIYVLSYILFPNVDCYDKTLLGIIDQTNLMYNYHSQLNATHPFTSKWYEWPVMYKPVWFYSSNAVNGMRRTISNIGNPFIWWFGVISFIYLVISSINKKDKNNLLILTFILSSFIPYIFIGRIMFMYHYFIVLPFVMLGIVSFVKWITEKIKSDKFYYFYISLIIIGFIIFYPVVSGMNISEEYINSLKWLSSWYF